MKRTGIWLLAVLLVALSLTAIAETSYAPGDTVTFVLDAKSAAAGRKLVRREDGLYLFCGFAVLVR